MILDNTTVVTHNTLPPSRLAHTSDASQVNLPILDRPGVSVTGSPLGLHNIPFDATRTVAEVLAEINALRQDIQAIRTYLVSVIRTA